MESFDQWLSLLAENEVQSRVRVICDGQVVEGAPVEDIHQAVNELSGVFLEADEGASTAADLRALPREVLDLSGALVLADAMVDGDSHEYAVVDPEAVTGFVIEPAEIEPKV